MPIDVSTPPVAVRTNSGGFETKDGTLYVSKPFRSRKSKKLRAMVTFTPRKSHFDTSNEMSGANEFRGFFTLFWISIFIFTLGTYVDSIEKSGRPLNLRFASMFSEDAITLAISDAVLVGSTAICVPFAKAVKNGWIKYHWTGVILQHIIQTTILFTAITWTFNRQWPWVQSGFLTLHSLVMIMKMHSYMAVNGYLQYVDKQSTSLLAELKIATASSEVGGWDKAVIDAKARKEEIDGATTGASTADEGSPVETPPAVPGTQTTYLDPAAATDLRRRLVAMSKERTPPSDKDENEADKDSSKERSERSEAQALIDHPNEKIASLATEWYELDNELASDNVRWPYNISMKNFAMYMLFPTLVYDLEYPRTDRIRPLYVFEKTVATFGTFALLYTITETFILPKTPSPGDDSASFPRLLLDLALPFMIAYILLFYIIFECICNAFAELSYFADRRFYDDWWNSTSWDDFSRKWNKPVHTFLLRHVYAPTIASYDLSKGSAMFVTFLLSACVHELVMVIVTQKVRMYLFLLQLFQIPLIAIGRLPAIKRNKLLGNIVFWLGLYAGFPLLCVAYVAY